MKITKPRSDNGFVLTELLILLLVMTLILPVNFIKLPKPSIDIENRIILNQLEAIAKRRTVHLDEEVCPMRDCWFNARGNINKPTTILHNQKGVYYELVIWLGFGRFKISKGISDD